MTDTKQSNFEQLVQKIAPASKLLRTWPLVGGVSAHVTALEFAPMEKPLRKVVVRQYGARELQQNPQSAAQEFRLLELVQAAGIPVPTPYYADVSGEVVGSPALVIDFIEGVSDFAPTDVNAYLLQLATHLVAIHRIRDSDTPLTFLPRQTANYTDRIAARRDKMDEFLLEPAVRNVLEEAWPLPQTNPSVLLHGDFWPGNILWNKGQIAAILDWEDAAVGDPLADVGNTRLELFLAFGREAMEYFTEMYQSLTSVDLTVLPYWELGAALRPIVGMPMWGLDETTEQQMREGLREFVEQALERQCE